jgi:uncharacterized protein involved in exopolysaccharide biosynthesis
MNDPINPVSSKEPDIRYVPVHFHEGFSPQRSHVEPEIDLMDVVRSVWAGRKSIVYVAIGFALLGFIYAMGVPNTYTTTVKLISESQQTGNVGRFGGLAAQFGFGGAGAQQGGDLLPPQMYPEILSSTDFLFDLTQKKVAVSTLADSITVHEFFTEHQRANPVLGYTLGLPFKVIGWFAGEKSATVQESSVEDGFIRIAPRQMASIRALQASILLERGRESAVLSLQVQTQSPEVTVQLSNHVIRSLSDYLVLYRTEKARTRLRFIEERHAEASAQFKAQQELLAQFRDQNQGSLTASAQTREQSLQSEYNVKFNVYNNLTEQLEEARIKLEEDTPVMTLLQRSVYPNSKSGPNRVLILLLASFLGAFFGVILVIVRPNLKR